MLFALLGKVQGQENFVDVDAVRNSPTCTFKPSGTICKNALEKAITRNAELVCRKNNHKESEILECLSKEQKNIKNNVELYVWGKDERIFAEIRIIETEINKIKTDRLKILSNTPPSNFNGMCQLEWKIDDRDSVYTKTYTTFNDATNELEFLGKNVQINAGLPIKSYYQNSDKNQISRNNLKFNLHGQFKNGELQDSTPFINYNGKNFYMLGGNIDLTEKSIEKEASFIAQISLLHSKDAEKYKPNGIQQPRRNNNQIAEYIAGWIEIRCSSQNLSNEEETLKSRLEFLYKERNRTQRL